MKALIVGALLIAIGNWIELVLLRKHVRRLQQDLTWLTLHLPRDVRYCVTCGADILGNEPHETWCNVQS